MALNKAALKTAIKQAFEAEKESDDPAADSIDRIAAAISDGIDTFVKGATVTVAVGIPVATAGSAAAQTGATTATGSAIIS